MKEDETSHRWDRKEYIWDQWRILKERGHPRDLKLVGRIVLIYILNKLAVRALEEVDDIHLA